MDEEHKSILCPNCSQPYYLKTLSPKNGNLPLFVPCGHTMCEKCVVTAIKCEEPLECCVCQTVVDTTSIKITEDAEQIRKHFPVNRAFFGELALGVMQKPVNKQIEEDHYINLKEIISQLDCPQDKCVVCHSLASKICQQCVKILCENCFKKTHSGCIVFADHILQDIETQIKAKNCKTHTNKLLSYYCFTCSKLTCMDCICGTCKNHDTTTFQEAQEKCMEELSGIVPQVDEMYRRLTQTAVDIGNLLHKNSCEDSSSEYSKIIEDVDQSYSKLLASLQRQRMEAINAIYNKKNTQKQSLVVVKNQIQENILKAKKYLNKISSVTTNNSKKIYLPALCIEGKEIIDGPWYIQTKESSDKHLKATINTELYTLTKEYVQIEGNAECSFQLVTTGELPPDAIPYPPSAPVYPPDLPKDVRQNDKPAVKSAPKPLTFCKRVPNYGSENGSQSSLSSGEREINKKAVQRQVFPLPNDETFSLKEDTQELVYISHVVNPHNFFVQKSSHQELVKKLLWEFGNSNESDVERPSKSHIGPGKSYLMFQKADSVWQRCRVLSVEGNDYKVFCYDFGSIETVSIKELRLTPPEFGHSPPPLAFKCRLANCEPISGAWTDWDAELMQTIINNKQAVMNVRRILPSDELGATTLECDLTAYEDGTSLAHALLFHERSRMPHQRMPIKYPDIVTRKAKCEILINNNDYKLKTKENVVITHVVNPDKFFVRRIRLQKVYEKLCKDLEKEYGQSKSNINLPEIGMSCVTQLGGEGVGERVRWERCVVRGLPGHQHVALFLPDCGEEHVKHYSLLRYISEPFTRFSALANECHLTGITPLKNKWHPRSVKLLRQFEDRALKLVVEEEGRRGSIGVALTTVDDPTPVCLNDLLVEHKFAVTFGLFNLKRDFENQVKIKRSPLDTPKPPPKNPNQITGTAAQQSSKAEDDELNAKDKGPYRLEVNLLNYQSPSLMYVSMVCKQEDFSELFENMQRYYSKQRSDEKREWKVGDRCSALCAESGTWRRAVILEMEGDKAKLFFTDFACTELVQTSSLRVLAEPFAALEDAAIKCHISGVVPAGGDDWPSITKEYLKDMLDAYRQLFIVKESEFKEKSMPIQLWVYHTTAGAALEPNISEWRCLNRLIVDQGLGRPDESLEMGAAFKEKEATDEITLSVSTQHLTSTDGTSSSNIVFVSDWLPPEPISSTEVEVEVMPTHIDNKGIVYFHQISQQSTLEVIGNALDIYLVRPDPKAKFRKWTVGEPCIAKYYLDGRFYRGTVMAVDYEAYSCSICYIDYGNEEVVSFENIRKSIALYELPSQALKCMLDRIRPPSGLWKMSTLDYVHKMIVEKTCLLKVRGEPNEIMMVDLKFDTLCLNDHLVEIELAVYTDDSVKPSASTANTDAIGPDDDWVKCMDEEDDGEYVSLLIYADNEDDEFVCNVASIHAADWIELAVVDADEDPAYRLLYEEIEAEAAGRPPLDGVYQNKGCVALLQDDGKWYRASILQYSEEKREAKVRFVDYGDVRVLPESDLREARSEWAEMEGAARRVTLHGVRIQCPESDRDGRTAVLRNLYGTLVEKAPLRATVVDSTKEGIPRVRLTDAAGALAYQSLIDDGSYVKCDEPTEPTEPK